MNVLMIASEAYPFAKTGGLADVLGSLPRALRSLGADVRLVVPKYQDMPQEFQQRLRPLTSFRVELAWRNQYCGIETLEHDGVPVYFIDNEYYFKRHGLYGHFDDAERFAFFSKAALDLIAHTDFKPDLLHLHDWQASLASVYYKTRYAHREGFRDLKTLLTIHNLKYQGVFSRDVLGDVLALDDDLFQEAYLEFHGGLSFLKGGIVFSDAVSTVSPSYAQEIKTPHYGENLDGVLRRKGTVRGIVNGIDYGVFNPGTDPALVRRYGSERPTAKRANKTALQAALGLDVEEGVPLIAFVSRLVEQKGIDLILHVLSEIMEEEVQFVFLGTGDAAYEQDLAQRAAGYPGRMSVNLFYSEELAHRLYAASDLMLLPSRFEPCGLSQLIALRYGSLPVVRETGGLADTVQAYREDTGEGNGFSFSDYNAHDMLHTIRRALSLYRQPAIWDRIVRNAMEEDHSWKHSAAEYLDLYREILRPGR